MENNKTVTGIVSPGPWTNPELPMFAPYPPQTPTILAEYLEQMKEKNDLHRKGAKADAGKIRPSLVLGGFARALKEVCRIGTFGAAKYTDNGWQEVPNGQERYDDAKLRHWLDEKCGIECDPESELLHAAHEAWNALARLDLMLREREKALPASGAKAPGTPL